MSRILLIGATGTVGRQVASRLAVAGAKARALVRHPDAARLPAQIEIVRGDLTVPETLDRGLDGATRRLCGLHRLTNYKSADPSAQGVLLLSKRQRIVY